MVHRYFPHRSLATFPTTASTTTTPNIWRSAIFSSDTIDLICIINKTGNGTADPATTAATATAATSFQAVRDHGFVWAGHARAYPPPTPPLPLLPLQLTLPTGAESGVF